MSVAFGGQAGGHIGGANGALFALSALTVSAWVRPSVAALAGIATKWSGGAATSNWSLQINGNARPAFLTGNGATTTGPEASAAVPLNTWGHICGMGNGVTNSVFCLGANKVSLAATGAITQSNASSFEIGRTAFADSLRFSGRIAEVAIWNAMLGDEEVLALARGASPLSIRPLALVGYYPLWASLATVGNLAKAGGLLTRAGTLASADHAPVHRFVGV